MRILRYFLGWYFGLLFIVTGCILVIVEPHILLDSRTETDPLNMRVQIAMAVSMIAATVVFARAWWVLWHEQLAARAWCITGSLVSLIAPIVILSPYVVGGRHVAFWNTVGYFMVPFTIGFGGILFGLTDAARPRPLAAHPHLGHAVMASVLFLYFGFAFMSGVVWGVLQFAKHKEIPMTYFGGLALCGFLALLAFQKLRQDLRKRRTRITDVATT